MDLRGFTAPLAMRGGIFGILIERVEALDLRVESLPSIGSGVGLNGPWPLHWLLQEAAATQSGARHRIILRAPWTAWWQRSGTSRIAKTSLFGQRGDSPTRKPSRQKIPVLSRRTRPDRGGAELIATIPRDVCARRF
jgi:hypothetical protein